MKDYNIKVNILELVGATGPTGPTGATASSK